MCNFKSGIIVHDETKKGGFTLLMSPWTESHSDLIIIHKLKDPTDTCRRLPFARVEFSPPSMDTAHLLDGYKLKIDEERTPDWFTTEMQELAAEKMRNYIKSIIVEGDAQLLIGGQFIVAPGAKIESAKACVINALLGSVNKVWGSVNEVFQGGSVNAVFQGGSVNKVCQGGSVNAVCQGGSVNKVCQGGSVNEVFQGGSVNEVWGSVNEVCQGGSVNEVCQGGSVKFDANKPKEQRATK